MSKTVLSLIEQCKKRSDGYVCIQRDKNTYYQHRLIWEHYYNCCIMPDWDIHHKNGKRWDNRIENLEVITHANHKGLHANGNQFNKKKMDDRFCLLCLIRNDELKLEQNRKHWYSVIEGFICSTCYWHIQRVRRLSSDNSI